jgi:hypothetical protein
MTKKSAGASVTAKQKASSKNRKRRPSIEELMKDAPSPLREDSKNLSQRAEWFSRRRSGAK